MIILIPIGGKGNRFKSKGFDIPKALINVENKPIIFWLLDNLSINEVIDYIYIPYNREYTEYNFEDLLRNKYPNLKFKFLIIDQDTDGAAHTLNIALNKLIRVDNEIDKPVLCVDSDNFYTTDIIKLWNGENKVFTFSDYTNYDKNNIPKYSYVNIDDSQTIIDIKEKELFKDINIACTGAYGFSSLYKLFDYTQNIIEHNIRSKNEFYISTVIQTMIKNGLVFKYELIDNKDYYSLGTPEQVNTFQHVVLFDLDGTLADTDDLYTEIWSNILIKYDIHIDKKFFNKNIKGLSDTNFLKSLLPNITEDTIKEVSVIKDDLFVKNIDRIILFEGAVNFIKGLQNCRLAIVTNCNKKSATEVLKHFKLDKFINILISTDDCKKTKPDPEPYILAIQKLDAGHSYDNNKCIVFEDSFTGYTSASHAKINKIFIKLNENTDHCVKMLNCKKFNTYNDLNIKTLLSENTLTDIIRESFNLPIYDIINSEKNVKGKDGGYICNIYSYKLTLHNNINKHIILKISNDDNILADTANKLNLYVNEMVFYEKLSQKIDVINIPKCYGVYNNNKVGIILEDLYVYKGSFNLNLNNNVNLLLNVVDNISKLHIKYYYINSDDIEETVILNFKKINEISYYSRLIKDKFEMFKTKNEMFITERMLNIMDNVYANYEKILNILSSFPLNLCHGDLKSPNIFYKDDYEPYFLDWQYINLSKGVTDIVFLLVESIDFNIITTTIVINYYYKLIHNHNPFYTYESYLFELKLALCCFPFFVTVWFNSENSNDLNDKTFPLVFMKNMIKYYEYFIDDEFIQKVNNS